MPRRRRSVDESPDSPTVEQSELTESGGVAASPDSKDVPTPTVSNTVEVNRNTRETTR